MILIIGLDDPGAIYVGIYDDKRENEKHTSFPTFTYLYALDKKSSHLRCLLWFEEERLRQFVLNINFFDMLYGLLKSLNGRLNTIEISTKI